MNILQLSYRFPYPPKDGGAIGIFNITKGLSRVGHEVTVLCVNTPKHFFKPEDLPDDVKSMARFIPVFVDTSITPIKALKNLISGQPFHISRFKDHTFLQSLEALLKNEPFDIIQLEGPFMGPYLNSIRSSTDTPVVMRMHNVEYQIWKRLAGEVRHPLKKAYLKLQARRLKDYETQLFFKVDGLLPITLQDESVLTELRCHTPRSIVPASVEVGEFPEKKCDQDPLDFFFIGGLDWMPNQEGLKWFLEKVWPLFHRKHETATFHIAGRNAPGFLQHPEIPGVKFHGEVDSAVDFMQSHGVMIVPLFSGSGMRIKIIEAMAAGRPVISTEIGAEGLGVQNIRIANTNESFISAMEEALESRSEFLDMAARAKGEVADKFNLEANAKKLEAFYNQIIS